jgi:hypothetical protein
MKKTASFLLALLIFASCEKDINIKLDQTSPKVVVDGSIENGQFPVVILSSSLDYFSKIEPDVLEKSFIHDAQVSIKSGGNTWPLKEFTTFLGSGTTIYYWSVDPTAPAGPLEGTLNTTYVLSILTGGKSYTSTTTIPEITRKVDSLWWEPVKNIEDTNKVKMYIKATDKPGYGDYIRYYTKTNSEPFFPGANSVFDDQIIDGTTYTLPIDKATAPNTQRKDEDAWFNRGDSVVLKLCNIDKGTYDFWRTYEYSRASVGNPFSSPTKVTSNITGGGLGYFGGYAAQYHTLLIPPR